LIFIPGIVLGIALPIEVFDILDDLVDVVVGYVLVICIL
jgi:hypothetical protein